MSKSTFEPRHDYEEHKPNYDDSDISTKPFVDQRAYGSGLYKRPINFVSSSLIPSTVPRAPSPPKPSIADQYLAIVFPNGKPETDTSHPICPTCKAPMKEADARAHYLSFAHQYSLPRSHTPSAIDRSRMGLKYLEKHGFDVDSRKGLGASGDGILYPIAPKEKRNKSGIGVEVTKSGAVVQKKDMKMDAGKVRKQVARDKKKDEKLRKLFYQDDKVSKYLGELDET